MKCNGKCHLKKKFTKAEDDKREETKISDNVKLEIIDHFVDQLHFKHTPPKIMKKILPHHLLAFSEGVVRGVFHPPRS